MAGSDSVDVADVLEGEVDPEAGKLVVIVVMTPRETSVVVMVVMTPLLRSSVVVVMDPLVKVALSAALSDAQEERANRSDRIGQSCAIQRRRAVLTDGAIGKRLIQDLCIACWEKTQRDKW